MKMPGILVTTDIMARLMMIDGLIMIDGGLDDDGLEFLKLLCMAPWFLKIHTYNLLIMIYGSSRV